VLRRARNEHNFHGRFHFRDSLNHLRASDFRHNDVRDNYVNFILVPQECCETAIAVVSLYRTIPVLVERGKAESPHCHVIFDYQNGLYLFTASGLRFW